MLTVEKKQVMVFGDEMAHCRATLIDVIGLHRWIADPDRRDLNLKRVKPVMRRFHSDISRIHINCRLHTTLLYTIGLMRRSIRSGGRKVMQMHKTICRGSK